MMCKKCGGFLRNPKLIIYYKNKFYIINKKNSILNIKNSYSKYKNLIYKYHYSKSRNNYNNFNFFHENWILILRKQVDFTLPYFISDKKLVVRCLHCCTEFIIKEPSNLMNESKKDIFKKLNIIKTNKNDKM